MDAAQIHARRWWTLAVLSLSLMMIILGNTVLNVALPTLVRELDADATELGWIVDAYALVFAGLLLTAGTIGDRYGRKGALVLGLVIFGLASVGASFATQPAHLIATRAMMGVGAAFVMPATLSILTNVFEGPERARAIAIWAAVAGAGGAIGPVLGGWLIEVFDWNAVFLINVPVVVLALVAGRWLIPTSRDPEQPRLDIGGAALSIAGMAALLYSLIEAPEYGWLSPRTVITFLVAVVFLGAFGLWERRQAQPMLDLNLFRMPRFSAASASIAIVFFAMFGSIFIFTQYLQFVRGYSALEAGVRMLPMAAGMLMGAPSSARLVEKVGTKAVVVPGLILVAIGLGMLSTFDVATGYGLIAGSLFVLGIGMGLTMAPATESIMGSLPRAKAGVGSAVNDTTRELGGALGVAVIGSVFASIFRGSMHDKLDGLGLGAGQEELAADSIGGALQVASQMSGPEAGTLVRLASDAFADATGVAFLVAAGVTLGAAVLALVALPSRAPEPVDEAAPEPEPEAGPTPESRSAEPATVRAR